MRTRPATTFWRIAAFGGCMLLLGLLVGGAAGMRVHHFAAATFRPDDSPAVAALPDDPTPVELPLIPAATAPPVAPSVPAPSTPGDETAATTTATRVPAPGGTPTATVPPIGYAGTPLVARLRAGQPLALLLLGYGGPGHDGAYLTDSLEVARLDPASGAITLISIPRDLWVRIPPRRTAGAATGARSTRRSPSGSAPAGTTQRAGRSRARRWRRCSASRSTPGWRSISTASIRRSTRWAAST